MEWCLKKQFEFYRIDILFTNECPIRIWALDEMERKTSWAPLVHARRKFVQCVRLVGFRQLCNRHECMKVFIHEGSLFLCHDPGWVVQFILEVNDEFSGEHLPLGGWAVADGLPKFC